MQNIVIAAIILLMLMLLGIVRLGRGAQAEQYQPEEVHRAAVWGGLIILNRLALWLIRDIKIYQDGDMWCAVRGRDLQEGRSGWGMTPHTALRDFFRNPK